MSEVKVDRRTPNAIYVEVGDMTVYIDNSTLEQIVDIFLMMMFLTYNKENIEKQ